MYCNYLIEHPSVYDLEVVRYHDINYWHVNDLIKSHSEHWVKIDSSYLGVVLNKSKSALIANFQASSDSSYGEGPTTVF